MKYFTVPLNLHINDGSVETITDIISMTLACDDLVPGQRSHNCKNSQQCFNR